MPTIDTFIIPPMEPEATSKKGTKEKKEKKKSGGNKTFLFIGLILLILTLPVAIYYISQQQELADTRSRAAVGNQCSRGETRCQTNADGTNTGYICTCVNVQDDNGNDVYQWGCGSRSESCSTGTSNPSGSTIGTRTTPDETAGGCGYIQKPPNSGNKPCNIETCGMNCGVYTYDCGQLCFDGSCGGTGCASGGGVGLVQPEPIAAEPTATTAPTAAPTSAPTTAPTAAPTSAPTTAPTAAPTSAPNASQCDASCNTDADCVSGLTCSSIDGINRCRNASCPAESSCDCLSTAGTSTQIDTITYEDTVGDEMPVSGIGPGVIGSITVIGSVLLLLVGLVL